MQIKKIRPRRYVTVSSAIRRLTYAVLGHVSYDAETMTARDVATGRVWAFRNHSRGGTIIRPIRATGAHGIG